MKNTKKICLAGLVIAIGIVIPMYAPSIPLGPFGSVTLASHVAIFIAMFISPSVAIAVAIGTTAVFFQKLGIYVGVRAATHIIFATLGALYIYKFPKQTLLGMRLRAYSGIIALVHAAAETIASTYFYLFTTGYVVDRGGFFMTVIVSVGIITLLHSMVDFEIANLIMIPLRKAKVLQ